MAKTSPPPPSRGWALVRACPRCGVGEDRCRCAPPAAEAPAGRPVVRLRLERRAGKPVTVLACQGVPEEEVRVLGQTLKARCGAGGTVKGWEIELQGEHRDRVRPDLEARGWRVKG